ncbi:MAG: hypothetical protein KDC44_16575 [Phaeodactylibacter sp.]|nr:hypothetical protein [Phaeodactylibacter sp.]
MKALHVFVRAGLLFALVLVLGSCNFQRNIFSSKKACEREEVGTLCFQNETRKDVKLSLGKIKTEIRSKTTICFDLYEGSHSFKAKQGGRKWQNEVWLDRCDHKSICFAKN